MTKNGICQGQAHPHHPWQMAKKGNLPGADTPEPPLANGEKGNLPGSATPEIPDRTLASGKNHLPARGKDTRSAAQTIVGGAFIDGS